MVNGIAIISEKHRQKQLFYGSSKIFPDVSRPVRLSIHLELELWDVCSRSVVCKSSNQAFETEKGNKMTELEK